MTAQTTRRATATADRLLAVKAARTGLAAASRRHRTALEARLAERARTHDMPTRAYQGELQQAVTEALDVARVGVVVNAAHLEAILEDGRLRTLHDGGRVWAGAPDAENRRAAEAALFGLPDDLAPAVRPVSGFAYHRLSRVLPALEHRYRLGAYGTVLLTLTDRTAARTTALAGDLLDDTGWADAHGPRGAALPGVGGDAWTPQALPCWLTRPRWEAALTLAGPEALAYDEVDPAPTVDALLWGPIAAGAPKPYWEAQVHGGVTLRDIESIELLDGYGGEAAESAVRRLVADGVAHRRWRVARDGALTLAGGGPEDLVAYTRRLLAGR